MTPITSSELQEERRRLGSYGSTRQPFGEYRRAAALYLANAATQRAYAMKTPNPEWRAGAVRHARRFLACASRWTAGSENQGVLP